MTFISIRTFPNYNVHVYLKLVTQGVSKSKKHGLKVENFKNSEKDNWGLGAAGSSVGPGQSLGLGYSRRKAPFSS